MPRLLTLCVFLLAACSLPAQEYRATLLGSVTDPSAAAVAGATVRVTNEATGVATTTTSSAQGAYLIPFLLPGNYRVTVSQPGFKSFERGAILLQLNARVRVDAALQVGPVAETLTVTAESPLLEDSSANRGQVIDNRLLTDLPLSSRNPLTLMNLSAGVLYNGSMVYFRAFDNSGESNFSINGGRSGQNEFQIDGIADTFNVSGVPGTGGTNSSTSVAYVPPAEATQEFKIQMNTYDAQNGRTSGGIISVSVKPGTKAFHGAAYEYLRRTGLDANTFANNANKKPRGPHRTDQFGFELDGPVRLPRLYDGGNRTFFMFAFEKFRDRTPAPLPGSVPTDLQRAGDFSKTFNASGTLYTIYDPLTVHLNPNFNASKPVTASNPQYIRDVFPNNKIPSERMNPVALRVLQDIPRANQPGDAITGMNNFDGATAGLDDDFHNEVARVDHTFNDTWKVFGRWSHNYRNGGRQNVTGWDTPAAQILLLGRRNNSAVFDVVGTLSPKTVLSARIGYTRFEQLSFHQSQDISSLGFPKALAAQLQIPDKYPIFKFDNGTYTQAATNEGDIQPSDTYTAQASLLKNAGRHSVKFGGEYRLMHSATLGRTNGQGTYSFSRSWTMSNPQVNDPIGGNAIASFLLGYMDSATAQLNATPYLSWRYPVLFVQDEWQAWRRLNISLGFRWDNEMAPVERYDRQNRGFDFTAASPVQVPGYDLHGGLLFAGQAGVPRAAFAPDHNNWQPRLGLAFKPFNSRPLVLRAGFGRYFLPVSDYGGATGFAQVTTAQTTTSDFRAYNTLSDPFPNGLIQPPGANRGLASQTGDTVIFNDPSRRIGNVWQFSAGVQYELPHSVLLDAAYSGSRTFQLPVVKQLNYLTPAQLALGTPYLNQSMPNPFYGVVPANTVFGAQKTIQRRYLLTQFPQFLYIFENNASIGESWYNSAQFRVQQRFRHGLSFLVAYTISKTMDTTQFLNPQNTQLSRELASFDVPQRLTASGTYEFPVGPRKKWLNSGLAAHLVGGWQFSWMFTAQRGTPMAYPDYYIVGNPKLESGQTLNHWFNTCTTVNPAIGCTEQVWAARPADTLRTAPMRSPNIRRQAAPQFDATLIRSFQIREGHKLQFRASAFNLGNTPIFNFPNTTLSSPLFGVVPTAQLNAPRSIELGFRYAF